MADQEFYIDEINRFDAGMNSGVLPQLLDKNQTAFSTNATHRGGYIHTRPPLINIVLDYGGDPVLKTRVEQGLWQGAAYFKSEYGFQSIVASIGGRIFNIVPDQGVSAKVTEITPKNPDNSDDVNSNAVPTVWLWQAERWMIIADGQRLPIFYDGAVSRRSKGDSVLVGTTDADFVAPDISVAVDITLTSNYTGPFNENIFIGDAFYQVNSSGVGYQATLKNLSEAVGVSVPGGRQIQFPSNLIGQLTQDEVASQVPGSSPTTFRLPVDLDTSATPGFQTGPVTIPVSGVHINAHQGTWMGFGARWIGQMSGQIDGNVTSTGLLTGTVTLTGTGTLNPDYSGYVPQSGVQAAATGHVSTLVHSDGSFSTTIALTVRLISSYSGLATAPGAITGLVLSVSLWSVRLTGETYATSNVVRLSSTTWCIQPVDQSTVASKYAAVYNGYPAFTTVNGLNLENTFVTPAVGATANVLLTAPFNGTLPTTIVINGGLFQITAVNNTPVPSNAINVTNINDTAGAIVPAGTTLMTIPELPVCRMGAYGLGRVWVSLSDGRSFIASDIVGGSSGSPALNYRDAVLKVTENNYLYGGGTFVIPGQIGDISAMIFTANLDASLGQGPLQVGTPRVIFSCQAPVDRFTWEKVTNPILTESLKGKGPLGQYGTILVNSDTIFRARDGLASLILARRDFDVWGNVPISREMQRVVEQDNESLLSSSTIAEFSNRILVGCLPAPGPLGIFHQGIIALNTDPISSLRGKGQSIYDGLWTGINAMLLVDGDFAGVNRCFSFSYNPVTNGLSLWEIGPDSASNPFDFDVIPQVWSFESPSLFLNVKGKDPQEFIELRDGEIELSEIRGAVNVQVWYRPDYSQCWYRWTEFGVCANNNDTSVPLQERTPIGLGQPPIDDCDGTNDRAARVGRSFQVRFQFSGVCKFMAARFKATHFPQTKFQQAQCKPLCALLSEQNSTDCEPCKDIGPCIQFPLVFYSLANKLYSNSGVIIDVPCPNGPTQHITVPAGTITFILTFDPSQPDSPPLILGCGNSVVASEVPPNSTQNQIDAIINAMILECVTNYARGKAVCPVPSPVTLRLVPDDSGGTVSQLIYGMLLDSGTIHAWDTFSNYYTSTDGLAWTSIGASNSQPIEVIKVAGLFVACNGDTHVFTSTDGLTWASYAGGGGFLADIAYGNSIYVAVGTGGHTAWSSDGSTWHNVLTGGGEDLVTVEFADGKFVAGGNSGAVYTSANGTVWASHPIPDPQNVQTIYYDGTQFIASLGTGAIYTSPNGGTWTLKTTLAVQLVTIVKGDLNYVAGASGGIEPLWYTSTDLITWTQLPNVPLGPNLPGPIVYIGSNTFIGAEGYQTS